MAPSIAGLSAIACAYDGYIVDLWGVIHDGIAPFPQALECLRRLQGTPVLLLSNAPRRADAVRSTLQRLGVDDALYTHILTSGEATWQALLSRADPWFARLGQQVYHIGPERDRGVLQGVGLEIAATPAEADFVLNTGPDDERDTDGLEAFTGELQACLAAGLKMVCANPDLEIVRGGVRILCAGALAVWYQAQGGDVRYIGKPDAAIYTRAIAMLGVDASRVLAIGDSLRTDIAGAANAGIDTLWVLGGIHAASVGDNPARAAAEHGLTPTAIIPALAW
jgi:HAD superfamily hydrolase (TIGR01459 family)